ncbi:hypothetical protein [Erwinia sp. 198]|uniref:hypothetical protein n=1 Tax=Erwinia sp. 198 TaxID=2022746 RepID=UPI000F665ACD|nr:hypothetical protein [Erwinia sp. 198]RRZ88475.1 hypothetical protein EGK14_17350 [Erwinia sp. 198]
MKTIAIATLLGLALSTPALADTGCEQSVASEAANSYVYVNRIDSPTGQMTDKPLVTIPAAQRLTQRL